jgi:hypothetical protein
MATYRIPLSHFPPLRAKFFDGLCPQKSRQPPSRGLHAFFLLFYFFFELDKMYLKKLLGQGSKPTPTTTSREKWVEDVKRQDPFAILPAELAVLILYAVNLSSIGNVSRVCSAVSSSK